MRTSSVDAGYRIGALSGGFGAEHALEPRAGELNAHNALAIREGIAYVDNTPLRFEIVFGATGKL